MKVITDFDVAAKQFTTHGSPYQLYKLEAKLNSSAVNTVFVQIHDSQTTPAEGAVPIKSWPAVADQEIYKEFKRAELNIVNGLYVCVSTTEATKTLGTGNNKFSMVSAEITETEETVTVAGDLTTGVDYLEAWNNAAGPHNLRKVQVSFGATGGAKYALLFAKDIANINDGDIPILVIGSGDNETKSFNFGKAGRRVFSQTAFVDKVGCSICISTTANVLTVTSATEHKIRVEYV